MKLSKIFVLASAVMAFTACSEEVEWNSTKEVTVGMQQAEMTVGEAKGLFYVPISISGERDAQVEVTVEVTPVEATATTAPAKEDVDYIVTSKVIKISADSEAGQIEIRALDNAEVNPHNQFNITIVSVKGATIDDAHKSTVITLKDNDRNPYERLAGAWTLQVYSALSGGMESWNVDITAFDEGEEGYEKYVVVSGLAGETDATARLSYTYDEVSENGYVAITMPWLSLEGYYGYYDIYVKGMTLDDQGYPTIYDTPCEIKGEWNEEMTEITFEDTPMLLGLIAYVQSNGDFGGYLGAGWVIKMEKK